MCGEPADLAGFNPWYSDPDESRRSYVELSEMGVFVAGSNITRDRPFGPAAEAIHLIDRSEMLVPVAVSRSVPFRTNFLAADQARILCEDRAFVADALAAGVVFVPSRRPTLSYRLGGYSN